MNESLDLRNRILKMRESNNLALDKVNYEGKDLNSNSEFISKKSDINTNKKNENYKNKKDDINFEIKKENKNFSIENEKTGDSSLTAKNSANFNIKYKKNKNEESLNSLVNNNEAQFRIIANKFNEAVEVILELSEKVKKLEETINNFPATYVKDKKKYSFFNIKTNFIILLVTFFIIAIFIYPIDLSLIKLIITDIILSI